MFKRIVVGTDGSAHALGAVRAAAQLAGRSGDTVVHVVAAVDEVNDEISALLEFAPDEMRDRFDPHTIAAVRIAEAEEMLDAAHVAHQGHLETGDPAEAITNVARSVEADLVVVGSRGHGSSGQGTTSTFPRGSVSTKVGQFASCSVLVVER